MPTLNLQNTQSSPYSKITYFGKGPHENYPDRKSGAHVGLYHVTPETMGYAKYIVPGENGSRSDCEWVSFRREESGDGLLVYAEEDKTFSCSAIHYTTKELDQASHTYDLPLRANGEDPVYVNIDHRLMGLGGDTR